MAAFLFTVLFMLGIYVLVREILKSSFFRAEEESRRRLREMMLKANPEWAEEAGAGIEGRKKRKVSEESPLMDRVSGWLESSPMLHEEEGRNVIDWLERQLTLAGLQRKYTPYQYLALTLTIWTIGILVPTFMVLGGILPKLLYGLAVVAALVFPIGQLISKKKARAEALRSEVPWLIHELSMALATEALTLDEALARVTRANDPNAERSPLLEEFAQAHLEARLGARDRETALLDIVRRTEVLEVATLVDTLISATRTGANVVQVLDQYAEAATQSWKQDTLAFINRQEPRFMIGMVLIIFGIMSWFAAPIVIGAFDSLNPS